MKIQVYRKTIGYLLFVLVLFIGNVFIIYNVNKKNQLISVCTKNWQKCTEKNDYLVNYFIEREKKCIESEIFYLSKQIILKGLDGSIHSLAEKMNKSPILVFRFSGSQCQTCIDAEIGRMIQYLRGLSPDKVIILVSDKDSRELNYLKKAKGINFDIYIIQKNELLIPMEQYNIPYSFILAPDGEIGTVFIPELNENKFSEQFYTLVKSFLQ